MKMKCFACGREMNLHGQAFSDFKGSIKCISCSAPMEIQTMSGVLIWRYPLRLGQTAIQQEEYHEIKHEGQSRRQVAPSEG